MTREEIIRMTREAGGFDATPEFLERFAALVAAAERTACIALCAQHWKCGGNAMECADAIRARGEK